MSAKAKVFIIYTGGTLGMMHRDANDSCSPLAPARWERLKKFVSFLKRLPVETVLYEMDPMDSSDINPDCWIDIARVIRDNYNDYSGFVVLHGTDTMAYGAAALSFLLENLGKPVIITGSQIPISEVRNDAMQNLASAIMFAVPYTFGLPIIPEVSIFFNNKLLRGNRAKKIDSCGYAGFVSCNYPVLADTAGNIFINERFVRKPAEKDFFISEKLEKEVFLFDIFPGITPEVIRYIFNIPNLKGAVLKTYGAGNAPTNESFLKEIEFAVNKKNLVIVNVTQCIYGGIKPSRYNAGAKLLSRGVISGADMTSEAALIKLMFLLGKGYEVETTKRLMQKNLRGEISAGDYP
ncbi:MAG: type I asparaginase [Deltaproteobacteria bacterium]|nr:type I asparaginase [Deltaproteobacteria bacterium]